MHINDYPKPEKKFPAKVFFLCTLETKNRFERMAKQQTLKTGIQCFPGQLYRMAAEQFLAKYDK